MESKTANQAGQIGIVVLLIMTTMLTVGIGAVSQSTRDLKITRQEVEASQVFNAAEAGIEAGLAAIDSGTYTGGEESNELTVNDIGVNYEISTTQELNTLLLENQTATVFTGDSAGNPVAGRQLTIRWADGDNCPDAASLIIKVFNRLGGGSVYTQGVGKCDRGDGFSIDADGLIDLVLRDGDELVRIKAVYLETDLVAVPNGGWSLPDQAYVVVSRAARPSSSETKVIRLNKTVQQLPSIFDYALFSGNALIM